MPTNPAESTTLPRPLSIPLPPHEQGRADFHALIAALLLAPPSDVLLGAIAQAGSLPVLQQTSPLQSAWARLQAAVAAVDDEAVAEEYAALFTALGTPKVDPYASRYLSGFMMDKPLAALRAELRALGLGRRAGAREPEDHLGALCETMRVLIAGAPGIARRPLAVQRHFFETQIAPWHLACLDDMRRASGANFYQRVADFIEAFFAVESQAFAIDDRTEQEAMA